jgi:hypothetical protein
MYLRVHPVRSRGDLSPVTPIQPYAKITPNKEKELYDRMERHPATPEWMTQTLLEASPYELLGDRQPFHSYVIYNKNKQKTQCMIHQGWLLQLYG